MPHIPAHIRRYIYGICLAAVPLLVALGIVEESIAPLIVALAGAIIAPGLALANISPDSESHPHWDHEEETQLAEAEDA